MGETVEIYMDIKGELVNDILFKLRHFEDDALRQVKTALEISLHDYDITKTERQIAVYEEQMNEQILRRFLIAKQVEGCTPRTLQGYRCGIQKILWSINKNVTDIDVNDIRYYLAVRETRDKVCKNTLNNELRFLKTFFNFCLKEEITRRNPAMAIGPIKGPKEVKKAFSDMEIEKIRAACESTREKALVEVLISTACRIGEVEQIKIEDIKGDEIIVHGKGQKDRRVYLNAKAQMAVENYLADRKDNNPWLFCGGRSVPPKKGTSQKEMRNWYTKPELVNDKYASLDSLGCTIRKIGKRAGVEDCHPHRFRRTCATMSLKRGMPIEQVSKMLGHESVATTQIYLDLSDEDLAAAHRKYVV